MSVNIFFSYAHEDEPLLNELKKHLKLLERQGFTSTWYDRDINAGVEWEQEINHHLNTADIILLLISSDFINSDYCYGIEMQRAIERHDQGEATVIPIILRPVYWQGAPFSKLQALPTDAKSITAWSNRDKAFLNITEGIWKALTEKSSFPRSSKKPKPLECTVLKCEKLKYGVTYEFCLKSSIKEYILKVVVDYGWKNTLYLDGEEIFQKQIGLIDSISLDIEVYLKPVRIFWYPFTVDGYSVKYSYFCKKWGSRSTYTILIEMEKEELLKEDGYY